MARKAVIIPENKEVINKIKTKYNNMEMSDNTALKIASLEVTNKILKKTVNIAGIAFIIDLIVPDPIIGVDEILLGTITAATKTANSIINNKIDELALNGETELQTEEINKLASSIKSIVEANKNRKNYRSR